VSVHYPGPSRDGSTACGFGLTGPPPDLRITADRAEVTCGRCKISMPYREAARPAEPDGDPVYADFAREICEKLDRLKAAGVPVQAIVLREDLWPERIFMHVMGYPLIRVDARRTVTWGVVT
jgi:hypothetical protein